LGTLVTFLYLFIAFPEYFDELRKRLRGETSRTELIPIETQEFKLEKGVKEG
jgi:hypothetical protein